MRQYRLWNLGQWNLAKRLLAVALAVCLSFSLVACSKGDRPVKRKAKADAPTVLARKLSEVAPPEVIQQLKRELEDYQPQVKILNVRPNQVLESDRLEVRFQVRDLPIFKSESLGLGPHLHVFLDNQPYQPVYSLNEPLVLEGLTPGTHTLRVFASRPWHESFKNAGAFAEVTFHVFTKNNENNPDSNLPLLTYSRPQGSYGAEPVMLDFYLTNAPLHLIAQERSDDAIKDWKIRCTVNGESFLLDEWQPIYLKGLKPGQNWVQLELIDEDGQAIANAFNNTVRLIEYQPGGSDTLSKLVRGDLSVAEVRGIVDPNYVPPAPELTPEPEVSPEPDAISEPETVPAPETPPELEEIAEPEAITEPKIDDVTPSPVPALLEPSLIPQEPEAAPELRVVPSSETFEEIAPEPAIAPSPSVAPQSQDEEPASQSRISRFRKWRDSRRESRSPAAVPALPMPEPAQIAPETPVPSELKAEDALESPREQAIDQPAELPVERSLEEPLEQPVRITPAPEKGAEKSNQPRTIEPLESLPATVPTVPTVPEVPEVPEVLEVPEAQNVPTAPTQPNAPGFFNRFRSRQTPLIPTAPAPQPAIDPGSESARPGSAIDLDVEPDVDNLPRALPPQFNFSPAPLSPEPVVEPSPPTMLEEPPIAAPESAEPAIQPAPTAPKSEGDSLRDRFSRFRQTLTPKPSPAIAPVPSPEQFPEQSPEQFPGQSPEPSIELSPASDRPVTDLEDSPGEESLGEKNSPFGEVIDRIRQQVEDLPEVLPQEVPILSPEKAQSATDSELNVEPVITAPAESIAPELVAPVEEPVEVAPAPLLTSPLDRAAEPETTPVQKPGFYNRTGSPTLRSLRDRLRQYTRQPVSPAVVAPDGLSSVQEEPAPEEPIQPESALEPIAD